LVFCRIPDIKPRVWEVTHAGNNYITIETKDPEGIEPDNMVKVVKSDQIYSYDPQIVNGYLQQRQQQQDMYNAFEEVQINPPNTFAQPLYPPYKEPKAPVVNVIVGHHNKMLNDIDGEGERTDIKLGQKDQEGNELGESEKKGGEPVKEEKSKNIFENAIDFTKGFFIKKV
jgi:hypothetical protein